MPASTGSAPELTREQVVAMLVQPLMAASVFLASGVRVFDTDGSPVRIPKLVSMTSPSWHGENEQIDEVEADFGEVTLLPSSVKSVKSLTRFSNELARQSVVALDAALRDRMVNDVAAKLDEAFIAGDGDPDVGGARTTPIGIVNQPGTLAMPGIGVLTLDDLHDAIGTALGANVDPSRLRWMIRPEQFIALRKVKSTDGKYILQPDATAENTYRLLGHAVTVTKRLPTTSAVLWDPSTYAVARDTAPSVKVLDQTFGDFDQQALRVTARYDAAPLQPDAVIVLSGITG